MSRDLRLYVRDMRDACVAIGAHAGGLSRDEFFADTKALHATLSEIIRLGEEVGECLGGVPEVIVGHR